MSEGRFDEAATLYRALVRALPANPGLLLNLGLAEQMGGHLEKAIPRFEAVLKTQPDNIPALMSLSMSQLQLNRPAAAVDPLTRVVKLTPDDPKAWYQLGKSYESLAASSFERLLKLDAQSAFVALLLAEARVRQLQYRSAFFLYRQAEQKAPELPGVHAGLAHVYMETHHPDWAATEEKREANIRAKVCISPASMACRFTKGDFLVAARTSAAATGAPSLFWAAQAYGALARQSFEHLGILPESIELHALKAQMLHDHRQDLEASKEWKAALALSAGAGDPRLNMELATSLFLARDYESAMPLLKQLLPANLESPDLNFMLGESLWRTQQTEKALPYLERALKQDPAMRQAHAALGLVLVSLNKNAEAIPHLENALNLDDDGSLHYSLSRAYQAIGKVEIAKRNMEAYQTIQANNARVNNQVASESEVTAPKPE